MVVVVVVVVEHLTGEQLFLRFLLPLLVPVCWLLGCCCCSFASPNGTSLAGKITSSPRCPSASNATARHHICRVVVIFSNPGRSNPKGQHHWAQGKPWTGRMVEWSNFHSGHRKNPSAFFWKHIIIDGF